MAGSERFLRNVRVSKRGPTGGLSGVTMKHLRTPTDSELLCSSGQELVEASTPAGELAQKR